MIARRTPIMGNGSGERPLFPGLDSPAIAHDERAASAEAETFDAPSRDFPMNRAPPRWKFPIGQKEKSARRGKGWAAVERYREDRPVRRQRPFQSGFGFLFTKA